MVCLVCVNMGCLKVAHKIVGMGGCNSGPHGCARYLEIMSIELKIVFG